MNSQAALSFDVFVHDASKFGGVHSQRLQMSHGLEDPSVTVGLRSFNDSLHAGALKVIGCMFQTHP